MHGFHISIEGNIAVGKTTLIKKLGIKLKLHNIKVETSAEPLDQWTGWPVKGKKLNLLDLQYKEPTKYAMSFQMAAGISKTEQLMGIPDSTCLITERSLDSQRRIFVPALHSGKFITDLDLTILERFFNVLQLHEKVNPDFFIYLKSFPEVVKSRAALRGRPEESGLDLELLQSLHTLHEDWLLHDIDQDKLLVVCADDYPDLEDIVQAILALLKRKNLI